MKSNFIRVLVAIIVLSTTMCTNPTDRNKKEEVKPEHSFEGNFDWKNHMVIAERLRDAAGLPQPLVPRSITLDLPLEGDNCAEENESDSLASHRGEGILPQRHGDSEEMA